MDFGTGLAVGYFIGGVIAMGMAVFAMWVLT